jgi:hypothetical protein
MVEGPCLVKEREISELFKCGWCMLSCFIAACCQERFYYLLEVGGLLITAGDFAKRWRGGK